ncbi:uncharacterized protein B0T15DRAFT_533659 [Chaetomium strumarium]|uniref:SET domain-containing protein n=1 Tax=Chaetomium strumarium TaxID=1170767 RepID=A0AAJ0GTP1_9PEZI|nr:hypothetical protein B0T15DRAFT_533659 [Chaetomium strumarium]
MTAGSNSRCRTRNIGLATFSLLNLLQALAVASLSPRRNWTICSKSIHEEPLPLQQEQQACPIPSDWAPWSPRPSCVQPSHEYDSEPTDCLFTFPTFRGNQGISLITTPHIAASIVDTLDDSRASAGLRPNHSNLRQERENKTAAYEIRDLPGRGKGLVAKRRFARHETIMVGFPVLIVRLDFINEDRYSRRQKQTMMERSVKQLPQGQQEAVLALQRNTGGEPILDTLRTNGFGIEIGGAQHLALFTEGSRVNHNCRPNAFWRYINSKMAMEVVALRDIRPGEEIAHSYAPLGYTYAERKAVLQAWGFRCTCALCSAPREERELSDSRRERILEIHQTLGQASGLRDRRVDELVLEATRLVELEELHPQLVEYYQQFAKAYLMTGNLRRAREFIAEADKMWQLYGGEEHENVDGMRELWRILEEVEADALDS